MSSVFGVGFTSPNIPLMDDAETEERYCGGWRKMVALIPHLAFEHASRAWHARDPQNGISVFGLSLIHGSSRQNDGMDRIGGLPNPPSTEVLSIVI